MGEAPESIRLVGSVEDIQRLDVGDPERIAYVTQTTLSVDETLELIAALRRRFPHIVGPKRDDICYATQNRQNAVKELARRSDLVLVIGSRNSSNSNRLVEVTRDLGVAAHLIDDEHAIDAAWLDGVETVGITSGASAPESLVQRVVAHFRRLGVEQVESAGAIEENVHFSLPAQLRRAIATG
jgi:4-hydroxy-3-methylbut-2-en-1-yl diphosphate reductase